MRVRPRYYAEMVFEDGSKETEVIRFPSRGWFWITALFLVSGLPGAPQAARLKDGSRGWLRPDGVLEFREPWHE